MGNLGAPEIILILLVILVLFGAKKIPELAQGLGKGIREFRKASRDIQDEIEHEVTKIDTEAKVQCYFCKASVSKDAKHCPSCGKSLEQPKCTKCGNTNLLGSRFCKECGQKLDE